MRTVTKQTAIRGLAALTVVGLGLVVAFVGSSAQTSVKAKAYQGEFSRLVAGGAAKGSAASGSSTGVEIKRGDRVAPTVYKGSVRHLPNVSSSPAPPEREPPELAGAPKAPLPGAAESAKVTTPVSTAPAPAPTVSFNGLNFASNGAGHPPDTVGDVGPTHVVQAVNTSIGIYNKTGTQLAAFTFNTLWSTAATGTLCDNTNRGDPTVVYDPKGGRWFVADFAFSGGGTTTPFFECIAVSKTSDPVNGGWFFYPIRTDDASHPWLPDYPKMAIWPDGLYMTANMFQGNTYKEARVWAFNRSDLEAGVPVRNVVADLGTTQYFSLMPSNMRTAVGAPPSGRENLLVSESQTQFAFEVWKFHVDYSGSGSTFTGPTNVSQSSYDFSLPYTVPTPANSLDALFDRIMMQSQYSNLGGAESLWVNHTVRCCGATSPMGIQWAQLNVTGGTVATTPVQQQLYPSASDTLNRWMGSLAVDQSGDMALGYSIANATTNPDIRYAGRLAGDPLSTLPQTETTMLSGVTRGSQSGSCSGTCSRWGDYSAMSIDPDGCRFWYTQEYYGTTDLNWLTRIGSFSFPSCTPKAYQTITFVTVTGKTFGDPDFTVSAVASSGLLVAFSASGNCTVLTGSTVHLTGAGSCTLTASQPGDSTRASAPDVPQTFAIAKASQTIAFATLLDKTVVDADFNVGGTSSSGLALSFSSSGNCTMSGATVHLTGLGSCTVTASQPGDSNYNAASPVAQTFSITKANQTITFGALGAKTFGDADFAVSASAASALAVSFGASGSCTVSGTTVHITGAGSCTVTGSQPGDANYNAAADAAQTFTIAKAAQTIVFSALANETFGAADFTVSATASSRLAVSFSASGSCAISGATVHLTGLGSCTVTAAQTGNANFNAATSVAQSFAIAKKVVPPKCTVPRVVGKVAAAKLALKARHCRTGTLSRAYSKKTKKGRVISQSRRAGRVLPAGTKVNLVVSRGRRR